MSAVNVPTQGVCRACGNPIAAWMSRLQCRHCGALNPLGFVFKVATSIGSSKEGGDE